MVWQQASPTEGHGEESNAGELSTWGPGLHLHDGRRGALGPAVQELHGDGLCAVTILSFMRQNRASLSLPFGLQEKIKSKFSLGFFLVC